MRIDQKSLRFGIALALVIALIAAIVPTVIDWYNNPGGVFRGSEGTRWGAVIETVWTWFWPIFLLVVPMTVLIHAWLSRRRTGND